MPNRLLQHRHQRDHIVLLPDLARLLTRKLCSSSGKITRKRCAGSRRLHKRNGKNAGSRMKNADKLRKSNGRIKWRRDNSSGRNRVSSNLDGVLPDSQASRNRTRPNLNKTGKTSRRKWKNVARRHKSNGRNSQH